MNRINELRRLIAEAEERVPGLAMLGLIDRLTDILPREVLDTWELAREYLD